MSKLIYYDWSLGTLFLSDDLVQKCILICISTDHIQEYLERKAQLAINVCPLNHSVKVCIYFPCVYTQHHLKA